MHQERLIYLRAVASSPPVDSSLRFLQLVAEPVRWQLVGELAQSDRRVGELVQRTGRAQNLVSYHLAELRAAGLVDARRSAADGRDTYYRLDLARLGALLAETGETVHPALRMRPEPPATTTDRARRRRPRVLFLCTGNSGRSQIAEALAVARSGGAVDARSAGSHPKPLHPNTVRVLTERGIDISGRASKHLDRFTRMRFDRVVTLCDKVREVCPDFAGSPPAVHWSMADPAAEHDDAACWAAFVRTADELEARVGQLLAALAQPPDRPTP